jgi:hypothetical protein
MSLLMAWTIAETSMGERSPWTLGFGVQPIHTNTPPIGKNEKNKNTLDRFMGTNAAA